MKWPWRLGGQEVAPGVVSLRLHEYDGSEWVDISSSGSISCNHQGAVDGLYRVDAVATSGSEARCVLIYTLLGSMVTLNSEAACTDTDFLEQLDISEED